MQIEPNTAVETVVGPVRVPSKREICWNLRARENGYHRLAFHCDGQTVEKELAIGDGFMRHRAERPAWSWTDMFWQPAEEPFAPDSPVQAIRIAYPDRHSWTSGSEWWLLYGFAAYWWLLYCFAASMFFGYCFRPWLKVAM